MTRQLTIDHEGEVDRLARGIRELHSRRGAVCREVYSLCCDKLRELSPPTHRKVLHELRETGK